MTVAKVTVELKAYAADLNRRMMESRSDKDRFDLWLEASEAMNRLTALLKPIAAIVAYTNINLNEKNR